MHMIVRSWVFGLRGPITETSQPTLRGHGRIKKEAHAYIHIYILHALRALTSFSTCVRRRGFYSGSRLLCWAVIEFSRALSTFCRFRVDVAVRSAGAGSSGKRGRGSLHMVCWSEARNASRSSHSWMSDSHFVFQRDIPPSVIERQTRLYCRYVFASSMVWRVSLGISGGGIAKSSLPKKWTRFRYPAGLRGIPFGQVKPNTPLSSHALACSASGPRGFQ